MTLVLSIFDILSTPDPLRKTGNTLEAEASRGAARQLLLDYCRWHNEPSHMPERLPEPELSVVSKAKGGKLEEFPS